MSKKQRMPRNQQIYMRQTKGYQQNIARSMPDMKPPEMPGRKFIIIINIVAVILIIGLAVLAKIFIGWWATLVPILLGLVYFIFFSRYMNGKQKEMITYYQKMGMTKKMLYKQLERQGMKEKNMTAYIRMWDIVEQGDNAKKKFYEKLMGY
ncbi:MAG: hypothetical protein SPI84_00805 [Anaerovoracaceae bacterium]|nr:hypothetical protein [Bacillota bacterium]MDY5975162.1 hypothetical protein [Anaerovoracaceae bacterium]